MSLSQIIEALQRDAALYPDDNEIVFQHCVVKWLQVGSVNPDGSRTLHLELEPLPAGEQK